jgi:hypothetical protein
VLYKDKVNALDVIQGQLKDCYFLSAISVLGEKNVEAMLKTTAHVPFTSRTPLIRHIIRLIIPAEMAYSSHRTGLWPSAI